MRRRKRRGNLSKETSFDVERPLEVASHRLSAEMSLSKDTDPHWSVLRRLEASAIGSMVAAVVGALPKGWRSRGGVLRWVDLP